jgi:hypothetical protein
MEGVLNSRDTVAADFSTSLSGQPEAVFFRSRSTASVLDSLLLTSPIL